MASCVATVPGAQRKRLANAACLEQKGILSCATAAARRALGQSTQVTVVGLVSLKARGGVATLVPASTVQERSSAAFYRPVPFLLTQKVMTTSPENARKQGKISWLRRRPWGIYPRLRHYTQIAAVAVLLAAGPLHAAITEPRLALMRATAYQAASGRVTLTLEGTFSFADAVQLAIPLNVMVVQGSLAARFDLSGNVFTSQNSGAEQAAPGPGIVDIASRKITLVLPPGFTSGPAMVQVIANFDGKGIASNRLAVAL